MRATLRWWDWQRYSARQQTEMNFGGLLGDFELAGPAEVLQQLLPVLKMGEWLHVGKRTTFGLGKYNIGGSASHSSRGVREQEARAKPSPQFGLSSTIENSMRTI